MALLPSLTAWHFGLLLLHGILAFSYCMALLPSLTAWHFGLLLLHGMVSVQQRL
jgi:hypothetical protein